MFLDQVEHQFIGWQIAFLSYFVQNRLIGIVIIVIMIVADVEKTIPSKPEWLVDLKI